MPTLGTECAHRDEGDVCGLLSMATIARPVRWLQSGSWRQAATRTAQQQERAVSNIKARRQADLRDKSAVDEGVTQKPQAADKAAAKKQASANKSAGKKPAASKPAAKKPSTAKVAPKKASAAAKKPAAKPANKPGQAAKKPVAKPSSHLAPATKKPASQTPAPKTPSVAKPTPAKKPAASAAPKASAPTQHPSVKTATSTQPPTSNAKPATKAEPATPKAQAPKAASARATAKAPAHMPLPALPTPDEQASRFADRFSPAKQPARVVIDSGIDAQKLVRKDPKLANAWKSKPGRELTENELLAMPDTEYMNEQQLDFFRKRLATLKDDLLSNAGETTEHLREDTSIVPDPADRATIEEEHALELRTRDRERKLLKKITQSLGRIDNGDYGFCDETGEPIGIARLLARPTATLSLEAQQRRELKQKMFGD